MISQQSLTILLIVEAKCYVAWLKLDFTPKCLFKLFNGKQRRKQKQPKKTNKSTSACESEFFCSSQIFCLFPHFVRVSKTCRSRSEDDAKNASQQQGQMLHTQRKNNN